MNYYNDFRKYSPPYDNLILKIDGRTGKLNDAMDFLGQFSRDALAEIRKQPKGKGSWLAKFAESSELDDKYVLDVKLVFPSVKREEVGSPIWRPVVPPLSQGSDCCYFRRPC